MTPHYSLIKTVQVRMAMLLCTNLRDIMHDLKKKDSVIHALIHKKGITPFNYNYWEGVIIK